MISFVFFRSICYVKEKEMIKIELSIRSLLNTSLITSEQISSDCNIKFDDVVRLTAETLSLYNVSNVIHKKLHNYYKTHKQTILPMHTYLLIQNKFDMHNRDNDENFLDFFETQERVIHTIGENRFKTLTGVSLKKQNLPFFLLDYSDKYFVYNIEDFEVLIEDLSKINPSNTI